MHYTHPVGFVGGGADRFAEVGEGFDTKLLEFFIESNGVTIPTDGEGANHGRGLTITAESNP